jgi:hypothetical protein
MDTDLLAALFELVLHSTPASAKRTAERIEARLAALALDEDDEELRLPDYERMGE